MSKRSRPAPAKKTDDDRLPYFVPDKGIDVEPLALYTRQLMDSGVEIKTGTNPHDDSVRGYWISSRKAMTLEDIKAIMEDTYYYKEEREEGSTEPYSQSMTWARRKRAGRAEQDVKGNKRLQPVGTGSSGNVYQTQRSSDSIPIQRDQFSSPRLQPASIAADRPGFGGNYQQPDPRQQQQNPYNSQQFGNVTRTAMFVESRPYEGGQQSLTQEEYQQARPYGDPAPPYFSPQDSKGPNPPDTTGTAGFSYTKTAGPGRGRHDSPR